MRFENPLLLAVVGLAVVLSMILPWLRQWLERRARTLPDESGPLNAPLPDAQPAMRTAVPAWRRGEPRWQAAVHPQATGTPTRRRASRLGTRRDLRRAIVLMTILGPCRALERNDG
jgi:hypothetical protein